MPKRFLPFILLCAAACSPVHDDVPEPETMVVEAWIESGAAPVVILSTAIVPGEEKQPFSSISDHIVRWAKVSVSDGGKEVVLTGMPSKDYVPSYIYTTGRLFGKPGNSYTLKVELGDKQYTAQTTIPEPVPIDSAEPVRYGEGHEGYVIKVNWTDDTETPATYKLFSKIEGVDSLFVSNLTSVYDDSVMSGSHVTATLSPAANIQRSEDRDFYYEGDTVQVKLCTMDPVSSEIMKSYDAVANVLGLPLQVANQNVQGNVSGALGYFVGYGRDIRTVVIGSD